MSYQRIAGLGDLQYDTGRGVFRPGGNGGGIFDGNIAGLGSVMRRATSGLGTVTGPVPSTCWNTAGFKDCQVRVMGKAQEICKGQTYPNGAWKSYDDCVKDYTDNFVGPSTESTTCVSQYCPGGTPTSIDTGNKYPWNVYSAATLALQQQTNKALKEAGYCAIGEDGKLGKGTCGAIRKLAGQAPSTCQGFTEPSKPPCPATASSYAASAPTLQPLTPAQQASLTAQYGGGTNWTKYLLFAGGAAAVLGIAYYMDKKKRSH